MSKEFYDFIAKRIDSYFQKLSADQILQKGESFCLKLDDSEMVKNVSKALEKETLKENKIGKYKYICKDGSIYETFTLKVKEDEIIIAAQVDEMTNDFLCATLRNAANEAGKPLLMISSNPIDSAKSGAIDLSSNGMPFYADNLMKEIRTMAEESSQLTSLEKRILNFELKRRDMDVFSDKSSLYEYQDLLSIMSSGKIEKDNFPGFRLFPVDGKKDYQNEGNGQIDKKLKENQELFERIDRSIRFGSLESDLAEDFEESFIAEIEKNRKDNPEHWTTLYTYERMLLAMEKKQEKKDNPLKIDIENISVYGRMPLDLFPVDETVLIRNDTSMKVRKRSRSIIIFNPDQRESIHLRIDCNIRIKNSGILSDDSEYIREGKNLIFEFKREDLSFHKIEIADSIDSKNSVRYIFKICIIDISPKYLISTIKRNFVVDYKSRKKNCRIKLLGVGTDLSFNEESVECVSEKLDDNMQYQCKYNERLHLYTSEEELSNYGSGISIEINFSGILVPFSLFPDEIKSIEITGKNILREKYVTKKSFELDDFGHIIKNSQEYFAKANLLKELLLEQKVTREGFLCSRCKNLLNYDLLEPVDLEVNVELREAYSSMLRMFQKYKTIPTLAYLSGELLEIVENYLHVFGDVFANLQDGDYLSPEQEKALMIGTIYVGRNNDEILFTPFHPLNMAYQLRLMKEKNFENITDVMLERLNSIYLLPYIRNDKKIYKVSDQTFSLEWKYYAPVENRKYRGSRRYVPKLVEDKISEFVAHFRYIFSDIRNKVIRINLINMGDCGDVFVGVAQYFIHSIKKNPDVERLMKFEIHIYTDKPMSNVFVNLKEYSRLKSYLNEMKLYFAHGAVMNSLEGVLSKNVDCYFHPDRGQKYEYAHISFYEMESEITSETATMDQIETGIALGGIISGVPSSKYGQKYRTGFGMRYAEKTEVVKLARLYNALVQVGDTGNPYYSGTSISTQIEKIAENKMDDIYQSSNWVVFVDPKVDLDFFTEKEANSDLLIIHYSDQYTSSSGYDAITVTRKSQQYSKVIQEYLMGKGISANLDDVAKIINLFNAVNGDWLLRLVSSKKMLGANRDSAFSREKISIVAAIKFMMAFLKHPDLIWVPISLEEMLRVSGGVGLSSSEGVLSYKNLGFEKGPTSDDLLFIGLNCTSEQLKIYLYPTEVKTGINDSNVISKAFEQVARTAEGFEKAMNPGEEQNLTILYKINRNFLMQLLITSCKKMKVYHVDDSQNWDIVLNQFRQALLNERYVVSDELKNILGKGAVLSFRQSLISRRSLLRDDLIHLIEMPERDEFELILNGVKSINEDLKQRKDEELLDFGEVEIDNLVTTIPQSGIDHSKEETEDLEIINSENMENVEVNERKVNEDQLGMEVIFGVNQKDGQPVIWEPNNTDALFHTNTGIIGTMGTGKTQFTKSLITQLYQNREKNIGEAPLGILIFDYKGDYNESKIDFVKATNAKVLKPYQLPFNPLALIKSSTFKPLLPVHTANAFKDTITKIYRLGSKQQDILFQCIIDTYAASGISKADVRTWENEAPTFDQVYQRYINDEEIKKNDSLAAAMNKLYQFQIFENNPSKTKSLFELLDGVVVIDLSGYDADIQSLIVAISLDLFYSQMQAIGSSKLEGKYRQLTKIILVDEADNFMSENFPALRKILKEGREFGVGTILSTQFLKHFGVGDDDYAKYILTWVVHNVSDLKSSDVDFVFKTESKSAESQQLFNDIKKLQKHYSIAKIGAEKPKYMKDRAFWELYEDMKRN